MDAMSLLSMYSLKLKSQKAANREIDDGQSLVAPLIQS